MVVTRGKRGGGLVKGKWALIWWWKMIWLWVVGTQCNTQFMYHGNLHLILLTNVTPIKIFIYIHTHTHIHTCTYTPCALDLLYGKGWKFLQHSGDLLSKENLRKGINLLKTRTVWAETPAYTGFKMTAIPRQPKGIFFLLFSRIFVPYSCHLLVWYRTEKNSQNRF